MRKARDVNWGDERRPEFREFGRPWERDVTYNYLVDAFDILMNRASTGLRRHTTLPPAQMSYEKHARIYVRTNDPTTPFLHRDADSYLPQLQLFADGTLDRSASWIGHCSDYATVPTHYRGVEAKIPRIVISTIQKSEAIKIKHQSLSRPERCWRWIATQAREQQVVLLNNEAVHEIHG